KLVRQLAETFGLPRVPRRIEVFDNSHIQGTNAVGAMIVAGPEGFRKKDYRKFNIRSADLTPGDDFAMMREVLHRRFKRLLAEAPLPVPASPAEAGRGQQREAPTEAPAAAPIVVPTPETAVPGAAVPQMEEHVSTEAGDYDAEDQVESPWPDLVLID